MQTFIIMREKAATSKVVMGELYEFWGRECHNMHGVEGWRDNQDDAICYFIAGEAEKRAEALKANCVIMQDYGTATQEVYKEFAPVPEVKEVDTEGKARKRMADRCKEAARQAEAKEDCYLGIHQCEICYTRGVGENDLNLLCTDCQNDLPLLLKSVGELSQLRELYQEYQEAKEVVNNGGVDAIGDAVWLVRFVEVADKLLE